MASMTSAINVNVDTEVKNEATIILKGLGLNMSTFINMALAQVVKRNGVPFEVVNPIPSNDLLEALAEVKEMINNPQKYPRYNNREDLKKSYYLNKDNELLQLLMDMGSHSDLFSK